MTQKEIVEQINRAINKLNQGWVSCDEETGRECNQAKCWDKNHQAWYILDSMRNKINIQIKKAKGLK